MPNLRCAPLAHAIWVLAVTGAWVLEVGAFEVDFQDPLGEGGAIGGSGFSRLIR